MSGSLVRPVESEQTDTTTPGGSLGGARPAVTAVLVVIPAHNEEDRIGACVASVHRAGEELLAALPAMTATVTVVLDRCSDGTATQAELAGAVCLVPVDAGNVGVARRVGVQQSADRLGEVDPAQVLVVNTDADCVVPADWLVQHVELAARHDLVLGEVQPDSSEMTTAALALWWERHPIGRGSLHGANLSVRLDAYQRAGGFPEVAQQEDLFLVRALRADGASVVGGTRVVTSGRRSGRVPNGFAAYLVGLDLELADLTP